jgi:hypothetical protein
MGEHGIEQVDCERNIDQKKRMEICGGVSSNEYSCAHGAQINFGDLALYFTCDLIVISNPYNTGEVNPEIF